MGYNGSGVYSLPAGSLISDGTSADAADLNTPLSDIATAMSEVHLSDGRKPLSGNLNFNGSVKCINLANGTNPGDSPRLAQVQTGAVSRAGAVAGTVDAIELTFFPSSTVWVTGERIRWRSSGANTIAAPTVSKDAGVTNITIKKGASLALAAGDIGAAGYECYGVYNGTDVILINPAFGINGNATTTDALTGTNATRTLTCDANAALWEQGPNVASAATIALGEGGYFLVTGTTGISDIDFGTDKAGRSARIRFGASLTLTNGPNLILPGGLDIVTAAGDTMTVVSEGSDVIRVTNYTSAAVPPWNGSRSLTSVSATGTAVNFTDIPAWVRAFKVVLNEVSINSTGDVFIQLGDSGGVETTGYRSSWNTFNASPNLQTSTTVFGLVSTSAAETISGVYEFVNPSGNVWVSSYVTSGSLGTTLGGGSKTLSAVLDRVRIGTSAGSFDAGTMNVIY